MGSNLFVNLLLPLCGRGFFRLLEATFWWSICKRVEFVFEGAKFCWIGGHRAVDKWLINGSLTR